MPSPVALEDFALDTHVGGYTGSQLTIRNYVSRLRFLDAGAWTDVTRVAVNAPTEFGGYWYFQSTWDPPPRGNPTGGMNFTGLGVGNRNGVYVQLAGCCLSVAGMIYAFYVKHDHAGIRIRFGRFPLDFQPGGVEYGQHRFLAGQVGLDDLEKRLVLFHGRITFQEYVPVRRWIAVSGTGEDSAWFPRWW